MAFAETKVNSDTKHRSLSSDWDLLSTSSGDHERSRTASFETTESDTVIIFPGSRTTLPLSPRENLSRTTSSSTTSSDTKSHVFSTEIKYLNNQRLLLESAELHLHNHLSDTDVSSSSSVKSLRSQDSDVIEKLLEHFKEEEMNRNSNTTNFYHQIIKYIALYFNVEETTVQKLFVGSSVTLLFYILKNKRSTFNKSLQSRWVKCFLIGCTGYLYNNLSSDSVPPKQENYTSQE